MINDSSERSFKLMILIFWSNFAQNVFFRSKTEKVNKLNSAYSNYSEYQILA